MSARRRRRLAALEAAFGRPPSLSLEDETAFFYCAPGALRFDALPRNVRVGKRARQRLTREPVGVEPPSGGWVVWHIDGLLAMNRPALFLSPRPPAADPHGWEMSMDLLRTQAEFVAALKPDLEWWPRGFFPWINREFQAEVLRCLMRSSYEWIGGNGAGLGFLQSGPGDFLKTTRTAPLSLVRQEAL